MSLALKYRPAVFDEVVGQRAVIDALRKTVIDDSPHPAYIFAGPCGTGKTTIARLLAKAFLCKKAVGGTPCGVCESCTLFASGRHPCYTEIDAASYGLVEDVRHIQQTAQFSPPAGYTRKFLVVDEAHTLTERGQTAFLRLLEDGSPTTVFILVTTEPEKLLGTVRSRCQVFAIGTPTSVEVIERLKHVCTEEAIAYDPDALRLIALHTSGYLRNAITSLEMSAIRGRLELDTVRESFNLDLREEFMRFMLKLPEAPAEALDILSTLLERVSVKDAKAAVIDVVVEAYKYSMGLRSEDLLGMSLVRKLAVVYAGVANTWVRELGALSVDSKPALEIILLTMADTLNTVVTDAGRITSYEVLKKRSRKPKKLVGEDTEELSEEEFLERLGGETPHVFDEKPVEAEPETATPESEAAPIFAPPVVKAKSQASKLRGLSNDALDAALYSSPEVFEVQAKVEVEEPEEVSGDDPEAEPETSAVVGGIRVDF